MNANPIRPNTIKIAIAQNVVLISDAARMTLLMQNKYQMKLPLPFTLGGEATGTVLAVGSQVKNVQVGDLVTGGGFGCFTEYLELSAKGLVKLNKTRKGNSNKKH